MTDTQWGPPLTGEQMKLLRAAGLGDCDYHVVSPMAWGAPYEERAKLDRYFLPSTHPAYILLEKGWLDGRNVRLWFGGDKAPDDWDGGDVLLDDGRIIKPFTHLKWSHCSDCAYHNIIAYIAKAEDAIMDHLDSLLPPEEEYMPEIGFDSNEVDMGGIVRNMDDTVTIAKMTEAEARQWADGRYFQSAYGVLEVLGLIKPEPTRAERFWKCKERNSLYHDKSARALIDAALEFER